MEDNTTLHYSHTEKNINLGMHILDTNKCSSTKAKMNANESRIQIQKQMSQEYREKRIYIGYMR